jgi:hypothetical protein
MNYKIGDTPKLIINSGEEYTKRPYLTIGECYKIISIQDESSFTDIPEFKTIFKVKGDDGEVYKCYIGRFEPYKEYLWSKELKEIYESKTEI